MKLRRIVSVLLCLLAAPLAIAGELDMWQFPEQLTPLKLDAVGANGWSATAKTLSPAYGIAYPGDKWAVELTLAGVPADAKPVVEVVRIGSRHDAANPQQADLLVNRCDFVILGKALRAEGKIANGVLRWESAEKDLPELGCYAVIVEVPGKGRQAAATIARVAKPSTRGGDGKGSLLFYHLAHWGHEQQLEMVARLGYKWIRTDGGPSWNGVANRGADAFNWEKMDAWIELFRKNKLFIQSNMYGSPRDTVTDANWNAYNYVMEEKWDARFGEFVQEAVKRWCGPDGSGPLQIIDFWNEPWEGGGISAWKSDSVRYRALYKTLYENAKKGSPHIIVGGSSSIMNTVDKFFSQKDWDKTWKLDVTSDHYVQPTMCFGPRVAKKLGIMSIETETWIGATQDTLLETITHFLAAGQSKLNPNHPAQLMWTRGESPLMCRPTATSASFFLNFTAGYQFKRVVFHDHLPWLYEFGDGKTSVFLLAGSRSTINPGFATMYWQLGPQGRTNGALALGNLGGKLQALDMDGNPYAATDGVYKLPLTTDTIYLQGEGLTAQQIIDAVKAAKMEKIQPVEFFVDDFITPIDKAAAVDVEVHNVLNRPIEGTLTVTAPQSVQLKSSKLPVKLQAGQSLKVAVPIQSAKAVEANAYGFTFDFESDAGKAQWKEVLHVNMIRKGTPTIDGDLADWADVPGVIVYGADLKRDLTDAAWKPMDKEKNIAAGMAEIRFKYDDKFVYIAVRERNKQWAPKPRLSTRDDNSYFGKGDMAHTYVKDFGDALPYTGNVLQVGFNLGLPGLLPDDPSVPARMIAREDTDYEYAFWLGTDSKPEIWRNQLPGAWPFDFLPRCMPADYNGVPKDATAVVKRSGEDTIYEIALPLADMKELKPKAGETIRITFALPGSKVMMGLNRSRCTANGMTLKPTWSQNPSNDIRWGFAD